MKSKHLLMASALDGKMFLAAELEEWVNGEEVTDGIVEVASTGADGGDTRAHGREGSGVVLGRGIYGSSG